MDREEIKKILPHREPMLLLDACEKVGEDSSVGTYHVRGDEFFLQGHYPGNPIMPGVMLCEFMAQSSCLIFENELGDGLPFYAAINNVKFKNPVRPGDTITAHCKVKIVKKPFYIIECTVTAGEKIAAVGEINCCIVKKKAE